MVGSQWPKEPERPTRGITDRRKGRAADRVHRIHPARPPGQARKLTLGEGETTQAVRRRLKAAAEAMGTSQDIRRTANAVLPSWWEDQPSDSA